MFCYSNTKLVWFVTGLKGQPPVMKFFSEKGLGKKYTCNFHSAVQEVFNSSKMQEMLEETNQILRWFQEMPNLNPDTVDELFKPYDDYLLKNTLEVLKISSLNPYGLSEMKKHSFFIKELHDRYKTLIRRKQTQKK